MTVAVDTTSLQGGPIVRYGGKGQIAPRLIPHFASARTWVEPFFGAGGMFFALPPGLYDREAVNDLDHSLVTFFRVLRDRTQDLVRACELTPYAREEFRRALRRSSNPLEEARRVWVRSRQGFSGTGGSVGRWGRDTNHGGPWKAGQSETKLASLREYAARLRLVEIDGIDACDFVARWAGEGAFVYADPPYLATARRGAAYAREMDDAAHERLASALRDAVRQGAKVAVSGYPSVLYDELYAGWRRFEFTVDPKIGRVGRAKGRTRTECLWMSYAERDELGHVPQLSLFSREATR